MMKMENVLMDKITKTLDRSLSPLIVTVDSWSLLDCQQRMNLDNSKMFICLLQ